jgi:hypothetical protein
LTTLYAVPLISSAQFPIETNLCAIIANPKHFDHKLVRFSAHYESDGMEHSLLEDQAKCKWGIDPHFPEHLKGEEHLDRAVWIDHPGTRDKIIFATWTGVFRYHPGQIPRWILNIQAMTDFSFTCDTCSELHKDDPIRLPDPPFPKLPAATPIS